MADSNDPLGSMDERVEKPKWRKTAVLLSASLVGVAVLLVIFLKIGGDRTVRVSRQQLTIAEVKQAEFHDFVAVRGRVEPRDIVYLDSQDGGRVERVLVEPGDIVQEGQPLIEFGNTDLQLQVIEREARLIEQINNLRTISSDLDQAKIAYAKELETINYNITRLSKSARRYASLSQAGAASRDERERIEDELEHYEKLRPLVISSKELHEAHMQKRIPEIRDGLTRLQQDLGITRSKLDALVVRATVSGKLTALDLKVGQICVRGQRLGEIAPDTGFKVRANIDEFYLARVKIGQIADIRFDGSRAKLSVARIFPEVKGGWFVVDLNFQDGSPTLTAGQMAVGVLQLGASKDALVLPNGAFLEESGGHWAFVLDEDGKSASKRNIKIGLRNVDQVEILQGLRPNEKVVISDYRGWGSVDRLKITD